MPKNDFVRTFGFDLAGRADPRLKTGAIFGLLGGLLETVPYILLGWVLYSLIEGERNLSPWLIFAGLLAVILCLWLCRAMALFNSFTGTYSMVADIRLKLADHLGRMPLGLVLQERGGNLTDLFGDRFSFYQGVSTHLWWQIATELPLPILLSIGIFILDIRLGLVLLAFVPLTAWILPWSFRLLDAAANEAASARAAVAARLVETVDGIKELKVLDPDQSQLAATSESIDELQVKVLATEAKPAPAILAFSIVWFTAQAGTLLVATHLWSLGFFSTFTLIFGLILTVRCTYSLSELGLLLAEYRIANRILNSIRRVAEKPALPDPASPEKPASTDINISSVGFSYGENQVLKDISLSLPAGSMTALIGKSGAGKSTLAGLVARLWDPTDGQITIGGVDLRNMTPEVLNRYVSMVLQDVDLFDQNVADNIRLGQVDASMEDVIRVAKAAQIHERIMELPQGYETQLGTTGVFLSGGERQRLAIARAILKDAPILILDEATASIDLDNEHLIQIALENLCRHKTVLIVAHRLWTVSAADQIVVLDQGKIKEIGSHEELMAQNGLYQDLWYQQHSEPPLSRAAD